MKNPIIVWLLLALAGTAPASIVTPFVPPVEAAHLRLERGDSENVIVEKIWLERKEGLLAVCGLVLKRLRGGETDASTLEVTLRGANGAILRRTTAGFTPRHLERRLGRPAAGTYRVELGDLPAGTVAVRVQARDAGG